MSTESKLTDIAKKLDELGLYLSNVTLREPIKSKTKMSKYADANYPFDLVLYIIALILIILLIWVCIDLLMIARLPYSMSKLKQLHDATANNDTHRALSVMSADLINIPFNDDGYTPFLRACLNGNTVLVKTMLALGADRTAKTPGRENAFYLAAFHCVCNITSKDATCIHALFHAGVDINVPNEHGLTAVQMAAAFGHVRLVQWLIAKGADLDVQPSLNEIALTNGYTEISSMLPRIEPE